MGSEGEKDINIVSGEPAFEKDKEKVKTVANGNKMREKKKKLALKLIADNWYLSLACRNIFIINQQSTDDRA